MKNIFSIILVLIISMAVMKNVSAQYGQPVGPSFSISINKLVGKPGKTTNVDFVDNLFVSDPRFAPGQDVFFKLIVKNTSNVTLTNVTVKDFVPFYIEPVEGPGSFDAGTRTVTFNAGNFTSREEKTYIFKMSVFNQGDLPSDKGLFCLVNKSQASNDKAFDQDTAQFCIEKQLPSTPKIITKIPSTGPELGIILLSFEGLALTAGLMLRKLNK